MNCAPGVDQPYCLKESEYAELARAFNSWIKTPAAAWGEWTPIDPTGSAPQIAIALMNAMKGNCSNMSCVTEAEFMYSILEEKREMMQAKFRPTGPEGNDWLDNRYIDRLLRQYEKVHPDFAFLGAVPSDCADYKYCQLSQVDYDRCLRKGKRQLGVVFNRDKLGESGSHWVALYLNLKRCCYYFCDSVGKPPSPEMDSFILGFEAWCRRKGQRPTKKINKTRYQKDKTECGVYSCYFIIRLLAGDDFEQIVGDKPDYDVINSCRRHYRGEVGEVHPSCDPDLFNLSGAGV